MMQSPDLEVLKDIPGYKAILKAVLRSQIQLLVEQLADHTGEESVLLTANVSDGSLCHLGSESGKVFLEDHEEIKSQFLGFCLKRHHKRKAPEPPLPPQAQPRRMAAEYQIQPEPRRSSMPSMMTASPSQQKRPRISESSTPIHPVSLAKARPPRPSQSPVSMRNQSPSHTLSSAESSQSANGSQIKQEVSESLETQGQESETPVTETDQTKTSEYKSEDDQDTNVKLEPMTESELDLEITGVEMGDSSLSGQMGFGHGDWSGEGSQGGAEGYDSGSQSEFGNSSRNYGSYAVFQIRNETAESDKLDVDMPTCCQRPVRTCLDCGKEFRRKYDLNRHQRIHTGEKPYGCDICPKKFSMKHNMESHRKIHCVPKKTKGSKMTHGRGSDVGNAKKDKSCKTQGTKMPHGDGSDVVGNAKKDKSGKTQGTNMPHGHGSDVVGSVKKDNSCSSCGKSFRTYWLLNRHLRSIHTGKKSFVCGVCNRSFLQKGQLELHKKMTHY